MAAVSGTTDVAFTVVDVLGYLDKIPVCVGYEIDGEVTTDFPTTRKLEKAKPVIEVLDGWKSDIRGIKKYEDLPENCKKYIDFVEKHIGFPITMVSNGQRERTSSTEKAHFQSNFRYHKGCGKKSQPFFHLECKKRMIGTPHFCETEIEQPPYN